MNSNFKKICVALMSAVITLTSLQAVTFAELDTIDEEIYVDLDADATEIEEEQTDGDVDNTENDVVDTSGTIMESAPRQYELLRVLGILDDNYVADEPVTRSMFAALMCRLTGATDGSIADFEDVTENMANSTAVGIAQYNNYMVGYGDGKFLPSKPVTQKEAMIALLKTAGYGPVMDSKYYKLNDYSKDLIVSGYTMDQELDWNGAVRIIYNALFSKVMEIKSMSGYTPNYGVSETLLLEKLFDLQKETGMIVADQYVALGERKTTNEGVVVINDSEGDYKYFTGDSSIEDHVGYNVTFYYDSENEILTFTENEGKMNIHEVSEQTFIDINDAYTELKYDLDGKTKKVKISPDVQMVYNGVEYYGVTKTDLENADRIRTVDGDGDGKADVVYVYNYEYVFVNTVSVTKSTVTDKRATNDDVYFDEGEWDSIVFKKNGIPTSLNIVAEWDILNIAKSRGDVKRMIVDISSDIFEGTVKVSNQKNRTAKVDGEEYYVSSKVDIAKLDGNMIVGLNANGAICVYYEVSDTSKQYGYLLSMGYDKHADELYLTYLDDTLAEREATISKKYYLGKKKVDVDKIVDAAGGLYDEGSVSNVPEQLFGYKTDVNGNIKRLYFASTTPVGNTTDATDKDTLIYNDKFTGKRLITGMVNNEYMLTADTKSFLIITDSQGKAMKELCQVFTTTFTNFTNGSRPTMYVYDADENCMAGAFLISIAATSAGSYIDLSRPPLIVADKYQTVNSEDEVVWAVDGYVGGVKGTYFGTESVDVSQWQIGDSYGVLLRGDKVMSAVKQFGANDTTTTALSPAKTYNESSTAIRNYSSQSNGGNQTTDNAEIYMAALGEIKQIFNNGTTNALRMRPYGLTSDRVYCLSGATSYYLYDTTNNTVDCITLNDINKIDSNGRIFVMTRYNNCLALMLVD